MSTFNVKSTIITNRDATPKVLTDPHVSGGYARLGQGYVQTAGATDGTGSVYRMFPVPSNSRIESLKLQADALATGCTLNVGVAYPTFIPPGAGLAQSLASTIIGTAFFASAVAASNALAATDVTNQSTSNTIAKQELPLWQALGLASDPGIELDMVVMVQGAVAAQGYVGLKGSFVGG